MIPDKWTALSSSCGPTPGPLAWAPQGPARVSNTNAGVEGSLALHKTGLQEGSHPEAPAGQGESLFVLR